MKLKTEKLVSTCIKSVSRVNHKHKRKETEEAAAFPFGQKICHFLAKALQFSGKHALQFQAKVTPFPLSPCPIWHSQFGVHHIFIQQYDFFCYSGMLTGLGWKRVFIYKDKGMQTLLSSAQQGVKLYKLLQWYNLSVSKVKLFFTHLNFIDHLIQVFYNRNTVLQVEILI